MLTIREVIRYRIEYLGANGRHRHAERATLDRVYDKIAWWLLDDRYGYEHYDYESNDDYWQNADHYDPYMRRLHRRTVRWLKAGYIKPEES